MSFSTFSPKISQTSRHWHVLDATGQIAGRLSSRVAGLLMGKHKPGFVRHLDWGDHVVITNAEKIKFSGNKENQKVYTRHTGYPGGLRQTRLARLRAVNPAAILTHAVSGMLPDNKLKKKYLKLLHIVIGPNHPYAKHVGK